MNTYIFTTIFVIFCISSPLLSSEQQQITTNSTLEWAKKTTFQPEKMIIPLYKNGTTKQKGHDPQTEAQEKLFKPAKQHHQSERCTPTSLNLLCVKQESTLLTACKNNDINAVTTLLKNGDFPNIKDSAGNTPLHIASKNNTKDIVVLLLNDADTKPNKQNNEWKTPLHIACENDNEDIVRLLCHHKRINLYITNAFGLNSLHKICLLNHYLLLAPLSTSKNWDLWRLNAQDFFGNTALSIACIQKHIFIVGWLLQYGPHINPNIASEDGETPLHYAVENFCPEIITLLLKHPATDPNIKDLRVCTIREKIILSQAEKNEGIIISESCKYPVVYKDNNAPLHLACLKNNVEAVELLLQHPNINIACVNADNLTAHAIAVRYKFKEVEQVILEYKEKQSQSCTQS